MERLKEYEDTGLEPSQIDEIDRLYAEKCKEIAILKETNIDAIEMAKVAIALDRLKEYEQKIADGQMIELPECYIDTITDWLGENEYSIKLAYETKLMTIFEELAEEMIEKLKESEG